MRLFEEYLKSKGLDFKSLDEEEVKGKHADYMVHTESGDVVCEVKEICNSKEDKKRNNIDADFRKRIEKLQKWLKEKGFPHPRFIPVRNPSPLPTQGDLSCLLAERKGMVYKVIEKYFVTESHLPQPRVEFFLPVNCSPSPKPEDVVEIQIYSNPPPLTDVYPSSPERIKELIGGGKRVRTIFAVPDKNGRLPKCRHHNRECFFPCRIVRNGRDEYSYVHLELTAEDLIGVTLYLDSPMSKYSPATPATTFELDPVREIRKKIGTRTREQIRGYPCPRVIVIGLSEERWYLSVCEPRRLLNSAVRGLDMGKSISAIALLREGDGGPQLYLAANQGAEYKYPEGALCEE